MFRGLSAFPLTPMDNKGIDEESFINIIKHLVLSGVDSIGVLGSTGNYAYLSIEQRKQVLRLALKHAAAVPVIVGISALSTRDVLSLAADAQAAGAHAVLLAPMSYQSLSEEEVFGLYKAVTRELQIPLCVYDNPGTTHFTFSDELHGRIAQLPNIGSIKLPGVPADSEEAKARVEHLRAMVPPHVTLGVSGDAFGAAGLIAGCDVWYSAIGGTLPHTMLEIAQAAIAGYDDEATRLSGRLDPLWQLFAENRGSLRVSAAAAEILGYAKTPCLPSPLRAIDETAKQKLQTLINELGLK